MASFPSKLGRYQIVKHLADGGMAQVLLARATGIEGFERHVVVKRIHTDRAEDPVFVKMFLDEARLAAQLHHNNIVQVHDIGKEKGEYFFAMEYVHGEDVRKLLVRSNKTKEKVPFEHVVQIVTTVALALHHAHEQRGADRKPLGLVHRDVSPANIIVGYDGNVKVVDFGIAKAALRSKENTKVGSLKGKASYMAPEQCAGNAIDRRSDVFALGIVLFELSTVRRLFKGKNDFLTMSAIVQGDYPSPSSYRPDIPPELEAIIKKALALDPAERYQSADEMREALEQFGASKGMRTSISSLAAYMKQVFGERPEPWLVDDAAEIEMTVDFDGAEVGAAPVPENAFERPPSVPSLVEPTPSSPIARARKKAETDGNALLKSAALGATRPSRPQLPPPSLSRKTPPPGTLGSLSPAPPDPIVVEAQTDAKQDETPDVPSPPAIPKDPVLPDKAAPPKDDGWTQGSPTTGSGTPLAWTADVTATRAAPKRKLLAIGGGVAVIAIALLLATQMGGSDDATRVAPAKVNEPSRNEPPAPPPPPTVPPNIVDQTKVVETKVETKKDDPPPATNEAVTIDHPKPEAGSAVHTGSGAVVKKKKPKQQWSGDDLFLPPKP